MSSDNSLPHPAEATAAERLSEIAERAMYVPAAAILVTPALRSVQAMSPSGGAALLPAEDFEWLAEQLRAALLSSRGAVTASVFDHAPAPPTSLTGYEFAASPAPTAEREALQEIALLTPDIGALLYGWHQDGTAWSPWDESIRKRLENWHTRYLDLLRALQKASRSPEHVCGLAGFGQSPSDVCPACSWHAERIARPASPAPTATPDAWAVVADDKVRLATTDKAGAEIIAAGMHFRIAPLFLAPPTPEASVAGTGEPRWLTPGWCEEAFHSVNPGAAVTLRPAGIPSLYLLDFAREVLRRASSPEGSPPTAPVASPEETREPIWAHDPTKFNADGSPFTGVGVRCCRGHWHTCWFEDGHEMDDLALDGDPFATREDAQAVADRENASRATLSAPSQPEDRK